VLPVNEIIIGVAEIAFRLRISERTARRLIKAGKIPGAYKLGGTTSPVRIEAKKLDRIIKCRDK
tara:strand:- start:431 stop:622 length:192 start_codon:yes stop_codon:yes gene_type:complete